MKWQEEKKIEFGRKKIQIEKLENVISNCN